MTVAATTPAWAQTVKVAPLGSHAGEFCAFDRAIMFEDPDGTRILYDAGRTVRGPHDERLGEIDAVLLSHVRGDHLGDAIASGPDAGECGSPDSSIPVTPNSNSVDIVVGKNACFLVGGEMASFLQKKVARRRCRAGPAGPFRRRARGRRRQGGGRAGGAQQRPQPGLSRGRFRLAPRGERPMSARLAATCCSSATAS